MWSLRLLRTVSYALCTVSLIALAIIISFEFLTWYRAVTPAQQPYLGQRILYVLGTNTDLPVVQFLLLGIAFRWAARQRKRPTRQADPAHAWWGR
jgi:hypothetical protein